MHNVPINVTMAVNWNAGIFSIFPLLMTVKMAHMRILEKTNRSPRMVD